MSESIASSLRRRIRDKGVSNTQRKSTDGRAVDGLTDDGWRWQAEQVGQRPVQEQKTLYARK